MAKSALVHVDDDGTLSIFATGDQVLLACERGHGWVISAAAIGGSAGSAAVNLDLDTQDVFTTFGEDAIKFMGLHRP